MTVFAYIDAHPDLPQERVVHYFKTKPQDALALGFTQATLSPKLKDRQQPEQRINSHLKSDDEDISDDKPKLGSTAELIGLCEQLEAGCIARVNADSSFDVIHNLCRLRGVLQYEEIQDVKQATLDTFWNMIKQCNHASVQNFTLLYIVYYNVMYKNFRVFRLTKYGSICGS